MVEPYVIVEPCAGFEPFEPPAVSVLFKGFPIVQRVSPVLAGLAEVIRRNSGPRSAFPGLEGFRVRLYIRAVRRDVEGDVPDYRNAAVVGVFFKRLFFKIL